VVVSHLAQYIPVQIFDCFQVCSLHPTNDYKTVNICAKFLSNTGSVSVVCPFGPQPVLNYGNLQPVSVVSLVGLLSSPII
jgi:hypothetical protein